MSKVSFKTKEGCLTFLNKVVALFNEYTVKVRTPEQEDFETDVDKLRTIMEDVCDELGWAFEEDIWPNIDTAFDEGGFSIYCEDLDDWIESAALDITK